jgi:hypothetical protein
LIRLAQKLKVRSKVKGQEQGENTMNNPASKMMGASIMIVILGACSAASAPPQGSEEESTGETSQALSEHIGYCAIDSNNNLTGACKFGSSCGGGGRCHSSTSSACVAGTHVTDPYTLLCNTCPVATTQVSQNTRCKIYF